MKVKNIVFLLLTISLLFMVACNKEEEVDAGGSEEALENVNETGMPIVEEPITIEVFSGKAASTAKDWNDVPILNEYADMTNIDMQWNQVAVDGLADSIAYRYSSCLHTHLVWEHHSNLLPLRLPFRKKPQS